MYGSLCSINKSSWFLKRCGCLIARPWEVTCSTTLTSAASIELLGTVRVLLVAGMIVVGSFDATLVIVDGSFTGLALRLYKRFSAANCLLIRFYKVCSCFSWSRCCRAAATSTLCSTFSAFSCTAAFFFPFWYIFAACTRSGPKSCGPTLSFPSKFKRFPFVQCFFSSCKACTNSFLMCSSIECWAASCSFARKMISSLCFVGSFLYDCWIQWTARLMMGILKAWTVATREGIEGWERCVVLSESCVWLRSI